MKAYFKILLVMASFLAMPMAMADTISAAPTGSDDGYAFSATGQPAAPIFLAQADEPTWSCSDKPYCGDMTSCKEARFHLERCGLQRLDRDKDGTPCESLCR